MIVFRSALRDVCQISGERGFIEKGQRFLSLPAMIQVLFFIEKQMW